MNNPFSGRNLSINGPAYDIVPVTPNDVTILQDIPPALYVETGGVLAIETVKGTVRTVNVADFSILPVGVARVMSTGTTATGIHALVIT